MKPVRSRNFGLARWICMISFSFKVKITFAINFMYWYSRHVNWFICYFIQCHHISMPINQSDVAVFSYHDCFRIRIIIRLFFLMVVIPIRYTASI
ncbi:hypothetical protein BHC44_00930 [Snodgrassella alvi]|nr:hypothetical protein BHC44_00930 [Snodgrassella alvi]